MPGETPSVGSVYELSTLRGSWLTTPAVSRYLLVVSGGLTRLAAGYLAQRLPVHRALHG